MLTLITTSLQYHLNLHKIRLCFFCFFCALSSIVTAEISFDYGALETNAQQPDFSSVHLEHFEKNSAPLPGDYTVDLYLNSRYVNNELVRFVEKNSEELEPRFSVNQIKNLNLKLPRSLKTASQGSVTENRDETEQAISPNELLNLLTLIPGSTSQYDFNKQRLYLTVPQLFVKFIPKDYVDPATWDHGITAARINYKLSGFNTFTKGKNSSNQNSYLLTLQSGFNFGAWRLRNYSTYQFNSKKDVNNVKRGEWESIYLYLQRDIQTLKSQLILGETSTANYLFDDISFRGIQMHTDRNMLPNSLRGFAPIVRGIALSDAIVTIKQRGYVIYKKEVPPGPFEITDLYQTFSSDQLEIIVQEKDGQERRFTQNYASVPVMEREGSVSYTASVGQHRSNEFDYRESPWFGQATVFYGLPYQFTLYGGGTFASDYQSGAVGIGKSMGQFGALSFDVTHAKSQFEILPDKALAGQRYRIQYLKNFSRTDTQFSVSATTYSKNSYFSFEQFAEYNHPEGRGLKYLRPKAEYRVNFNQHFQKRGRVYLNVSQKQYWEDSEQTTTIQTGYGYSTGSGVNVALNYNYGKERNRRTEAVNTHQVSLNLQVPLGKKQFNSRYFGYQTLYQKGGDTMHTLSVYGTALEKKNLSYSAYYSISQKHSNSASISTTYTGSKGAVNLGYSHSDTSDRISYSVAGGVVAHSKGVSLSQTLNNTVVLVDAQKAKGVNLQNRSTIKTDRFGYAVMPYATPYQNNRINLDVHNADISTDILKSSAVVTPTEGAIVKAGFVVQQGYRALMTLNNNGISIPFGATVQVFEGNRVVSDSVVGDNGEAYLSGLSRKGTVRASWGNQICSVPFTLIGSENDLIFTTLSCQ